MKILLSGFCLLSFLSLSAQDSLTILFAGDAMMHQKQLDNTQRGDFFDLDSYFANIEREVKAVDIAVVNFEVPLGGEPYSGFQRSGKLRFGFAKSRLRLFLVSQ